MKTFRKILAIGAVALSTVSCNEFLDVNNNPNGPQKVSANLYLAPMIHWMVTSPQFDGRFLGRYTQEFVLTGTVLSTWDRMGYDPSSDNGAQQWRDVYWTLGQNLVDMTNLAEAEERWDLLGVAKVLKAWGWQVTTDMHGEIIVKEAIDQSKFAFNYDSQEYAYQEIQKLLNEAIVLLKRTDGAVDQAYLARTDKLYGGDRTKWLKLAYGMLALNLNHYSKKAAYKPADVIAAVNLSFTSNADDALLTYPNTQNDDINFWGRTRGNFNAYRQTQFVVGLMNGTQFGGAVDPRMSRMLSPAPDGVYRGLDVNVVGFGALTATQQPNNVYGYPGTGGLAVPGRYIFDDKAKIPLMTYAQLQFIKAEAAYKMGDMGTALAAYTAGVSSHIDFVNSRNLDNNQTPTQISAAEKAAFLANTAIVPASPAGLSLTRIMSQKYIAQWGWGHNEIWMDMRRYNYTDVDPASGMQVFPGFTPPTSLYPDNGGKIVQRVRPRFNSEYVWNLAALEVIGGRALDYHTKPLWITQP
ncbi:RagB/SusD family nutrient uptake outer membrane protein [Gemmatimonas groenlandica]|uniref:RagB/SusD family nutrient uptake outer membrane protein n=1 Tax=Gemmatimonas groenlandica TaxID=2732249 RepID=A0A6M4ISH8_9BACT|nr:RagB/SusD family nutrient uptake outer membrane protein [Gemmatimonas groenlandica]QJR35772.1 RagB/SusD family nutrient uptake outer membrane protein [Gemmatimonas groenlandica]